MKYIFFSGKGGVGKTTCAAARAVADSSALAPRRGKLRRRVLVVSTDPAHSLGDVLGVALTSRPRRVAPGLDAVELDAPRAFARWLDRHRRALGEAIEHGTFLDNADVEALLDLTIPGIDELLGLIEIDRLASRAYDRVVVDTAPTGHTLRLLSSPATVSGVAAVLDALQEPHRVIRRQLAGVAGEEAADRLIELLARQATDLATMLRDPRQTTFCWVTLPEPMSIAETVDGVAAVEARGIRIGELLVNRVLPRGDACPLCDPRRTGERRAVATIRNTLGGGRRIRTIPATLDEPRGLAALSALGVAHPGSQPSRRAVVSWSERGQTGVRAVSDTSPRGAEGVSERGQTGVRHRSEESRSRVGAESERLALDALDGTRLLFVGGKGGVGKTSVAAALAQQLARRLPHEPVLLFSTDPAHSLADVFGVAVDDTPRPIRGAPPNLHVRELDAGRVLQAKRDALEAALDDLPAGPLAASSSAVSALIDLAPPGIDELFGMLEVVEHAADYSLVVVDTAPTGHALRLLEMPETARDWTQVLLRMLLKYRAVVRPGRFARELVEASQAIRDLQSLLRDDVRTRFLVVTRAARVTRAETRRLIARLRALHLAIPAVIVNARTLTSGSCRWCRATGAAEQRETGALAQEVRRGRRPRDCAIIQVPLVAPAPRGAQALDRWAQRWTV